MKLTEAYQVKRMIETQKGFDKLISMLIENDHFEAMSDVNVIVGKAIDEVAKKNQIPFCLHQYYMHEPFNGNYYIT